MLQENTPYIVLPMTEMDALLHQLLIFREVCPDHLKDSLEFAIKRFGETALYMHGRENRNAKVKPANYRLK